MGILSTLLGKKKKKKAANHLADYYNADYHTYDNAKDDSNPAGNTNYIDYINHDRNKYVQNSENAAQSTKQMQAAKKKGKMVLGIPPYDNIIDNKDSYIDMETNKASTSRKNHKSYINDGYYSNSSNYYNNNNPGGYDIYSNNSSSSEDEAIPIRAGRYSANNSNYGYSDYNRPYNYSSNYGNNNNGDYNNYYGSNYGNNNHGSDFFSSHPGNAPDLFNDDNTEGCTIM